MTLRRFVLAALFGIGALSSAQAATIRTDALTAPQTLTRTDDGSTGAVNLGFAANFYGVTVNQVYVNNNGNVTLNGANTTFNPTGITGAVRAIIAPFFADVDTTNYGSDNGSAVTYGTGMVEGHNAFVVNWLNVGFFNNLNNSTAFNSFQLVLIQREDVGAGAFDIEFNYGAITWEAGRAAPTPANANGIGGLPARVGFSNGMGTYTELTGSGVSGAFVTGGAQSLEQGSNIGVAGRYKWEARGATVTAAPSAVPVPATLPLMLIGPALLVLARRRARKV